MHDDRRLVEERIERLRSRVIENIYTEVLAIDAEAWRAPGEPVSFETARAATYAPFPRETQWGPAWSTWWLKLVADVPVSLRDQSLELCIDLGFDGDWAGNQSEGMVFTADGYPLKGVNPMNRTVPLIFGAERRSLLDDDGRLELYVEAAANPNLSHVIGRVTMEGDLHTRAERPTWTFKGADLVVRDEHVWGLHMDLDVLDGVMRQLPTDSTWRATLLRGLESACDLVDERGISQGAAAARDVLAPLLASGAAKYAQHMTAVGHAHIDTAWLWPLRETRRKIVRTFSNVATLTEEYPDFHFANSAPQHYQWLAEDQPAVAQRVKAAMDRGQWHLVGGMWIEPDGTMPSGESMVRQFTCGLRYMRDEWGYEADCFWLPDSFGYGGQLPQIARLAGMRWFFTQKLSWNRVNKFPHNTMWWEGIDGTRIWTHFPPCDSYDTIVSPQEVLDAERNFKEKGRARHSLLPFGYGDGGGGPVREMVERIRRFKDVQGAPVVEAGSPQQFFESAYGEHEPHVWTGELYLELHRGIFTSLVALKQGNRRSEALLQAVEWLASLAAARGAKYPAEQLEKLWRRVLVLQFHDILPGSSIAWVNREAIEEYAAIAGELRALLDEAWRALSEGEGQSVVNASDVPRREVMQCGDELRWVEVPAFATAPVPTTSDLPQGVSEVSVTRGDGIELDNGLVRVTIAADGTVSSVCDIDAERELVLPGCGANVLRVHPDHPSCFDAWELEAQYRHSVTELRDVQAMRVDESGPLRASVTIERAWGDSTVTQHVILDAGSRSVQFVADVDWQERETLLKASFPLDISATHTQAETQFGHVSRPLAENTSWDHARFEMCAHRWIRVAEPGYAAALAIDSGYGYDARLAGGSDARPTTGVDVGLSLLRAPASPDPLADQGRHTLRYSLTVGAEVLDAHRAGVALNQPLTLMSGEAALPSSVTWTPLTPASAVVVDAVCQAHSGGTLIRLHEAAGARSRVRLNWSTAGQVSEVDVLEREHSTQQLPDGPTREVELQLRPFQIMTLIVR